VLIAARDFPRQRAKDTACAWIVAVRFVQILVDQLWVGKGRPARCGGVHLTLPVAKCRADGLDQQDTEKALYIMWW
jgi:hypothetical protein